MKFHTWSLQAEAVQAVVLALQIGQVPEVQVADLEKVKQV
jgi:hypothetical protein